MEEFIPQNKSVVKILGLLFCFQQSKIANGCLKIIEMSSCIIVLQYLLSMTVLTNRIFTTTKFFRTSNLHYFIFFRT